MLLKTSISASAAGNPLPCCRSPSPFPPPSISLFRHTIYLQFHFSYLLFLHPIYSPFLTRPSPSRTFHLPSPFFPSYLKCGLFGRYLVLSHFLSPIPALFLSFNCICFLPSSCTPSPLHFSSFPFFLCPPPLYTASSPGSCDPPVPHGLWVTHQQVTRISLIT